jgi:(hydroxyamino)benzene mutase
MNGIFLVVGAIWNEVHLSPPAKTAEFWTALYGTYANWAFTTLGAMLGTAAANPVSAAGYHGQPWQESLVGAGFQSVAVSIIASCVLVLWGGGAFGQDLAMNNACWVEQIDIQIGGPR